MKRFGNYLRGLAIKSVAMLSSVALTCCSDDENGPSARNWDIAIEAVMEGGTRTDATVEDIIHNFTTGDSIYVYNATKRTLLNGCLKPMTVGQTRTTLVPYDKLKGKVEVGDKLYLTYVPYCEMSQERYNTLLSILKGRGYGMWVDGPVYYYGTMSGYKTLLPDDAMSFDYAESTVQVESTDDGIIRVKEDKAEFAHSQSIFQLTFRFEDKDGNNVDVGSLYIKEHGVMVYSIYIDLNLDKYKSDQEYYSIQPYLLTDGVSMVRPFSYGNHAISEIELHFTVHDANTNITYHGHLDAPDGKFQNGKIYCPTEPIVMKEEAN